MEFYDANSFRVLDCAIVTWLSENRDYRKWDTRDVRWSPDLRLLNLIHPLKIGEYVRSLGCLSENPHPHTFIVAQKTQEMRKYIKPIVSGYEKSTKRVKRAQSDCVKTEKKPFFLAMNRGINEIA